MKNRYLLLLASLSTGCQKMDDPALSLTPATQTGANTLSFLVSGRVWQPYGRRCFGYGGGPCIDEPLSIYYNARRGQFQLVAFLTNTLYVEHFSLDCDSLFQRGPFVLPLRSNTYRALSGGLGYGPDRLPGDPDYNTDNPAQTHIIITRLDTVAHVISGTFDGYLVNSLNKAQTVSLTDGRFDVRYK